MALEFYGSAIAGLSAAVDKKLTSEVSAGIQAPASDDVLLAILLLCVHEAHNFSDASRIFPHLNAAVVILRQRLCFAPPNPELRTFLLEIFCYFFALVVFSHGWSLDIVPAAWVFESISVNGGDSRSQSLLLGPSQDLIATIFRVSMLTMHSPNKLIDDERRLELTRIELQLQSLDTNSPTTDQGDLSHDDLALFELYRLACLVYVRKTLNPQISPRDHPLQQTVTSFVNELGSLPGGIFERSFSLAAGCRWSLRCSQCSSAHYYWAFSHDL